MRGSRFILVLLLQLFSAQATLACGDGYPVTAQSVVEAYLKEDFTRGPDHWERVSKYTTWVDGPGWDVTILVNGYRVNKANEAAGYADVEVEYLYPSTSSYEESGPRFEHTASSEIVVFRLVREKGCWKIKDPQNPPHLNVEYYRK